MKTNHSFDGESLVLAQSQKQLGVCAILEVKILSIDDFVKNRCIE